MEATMRGRDLVTGLPKEVTVDDSEIRRAMKHSIDILTNTIKATIEATPPELVADIMHRGVVLVGGGSLLRGVDELIASETHIPVEVAEDPLTAVVRGTGIILEDLDGLAEVLIGQEYQKTPTV
ncbi:MAG: rod shape-determining protein, partial [Candidatus Sungbacteria bacterium]|nr:rod shape-determining protein [Candidatus Sungbacteria bacterium]